MIARHDGAIKPRIVHGTKKPLADAFRCSTDRDRRAIGVEGEDPLSRGDIACQGFEGDSDCAWSVL
jgi:hypothetical protein